MKKQYNVVVTERKSVARSKRLRESGQSGSGTVVTVVGGGMEGSGGSTGNSHTHDNLSTLNRIKTDTDDYLTLRTPKLNEETGVVIMEEERVKAGYADEAGHATEADHATDADHADMAHDLDEDSPVFDKMLSSVDDDEAAGVIKFLKGLISDALTSPDFVSGDLGNGFILKYDPETGRSYLEVDDLLVRKIAYFVELVIKQLRHAGGEIILTPASMKCDKVEVLETAYRCHFKQDDGDRDIKQEFVAGDQARCQTFNIKEGTSHNVKNRYYWRLVTAAGDDYIDLSKTDCDTGSGIPAAGDDIVQLGNRNDAARQNAIILSTVGDDAPSFKQYKGINGYILKGKEVTILSATLNRLIGQFISETTGKSYDAMFEEIQADVDIIKEQTDKEYSLWFFEYVPTLDNIPASDWKTPELKTMHEQDMFYNRLTGFAYRFEKSGDSWSWNSITDQQTVKALENAAKAQDTADGKRRVFVDQPTNAQAYDVGDMWTNATYPSKYENDTLVCKTAKAAGAVFSIDHWKPAMKYTTAEIKNLGDSILLKVSNTKDELDGLITQNKQSAGDAIRQAQAAAESASSAMGKALEAFKNAGTAQSSADDAATAATKNATAIQATNKAITALAAKVTFDPDGNITNIDKSGLVTEADFNTLLTEKVSFDDSGKVTSISTAGLVTEAGFAGLFAAQSTKDGLVKEADIKAFITKDDAGKLISNATVSADQIRLEGLVTANGNFKILEDGSIETTNGKFTGEINGTSGKIGGFEIASGRIGSVASASDNNGGGLAIYDGLIRVGASDGYVMIGNNVIPASAGGAFTATGRIVNRHPNIQGDYGLDQANYGLFIDVSGGTKNYGISSNAALTAPAFINTRAKLLTFTGNGYTVDFSQHNIILMYFNQPNYDSASVTLPDESSLCGQFGLKALPSDFAAVVTFRVRPGSKVIVLKGIHNHNEDVQDYKMAAGDSAMVLASKADGFRYQILNHLF